MSTVVHLALKYLAHLFVVSHSNIKLMDLIASNVCAISAPKNVHLQVDQIPKMLNRDSLQNLQKVDFGVKSIAKK